MACGRERKEMGAGAWEDIQNGITFELGGQWGQKKGKSRENKEEGVEGKRETFVPMYDSRLGTRVRFILYARNSPGS
jgi:hypothetical protein